MLIANSYTEICRILLKGFRERYPHKSSILTGIVFARPELDLVQKEIIPNIDYWFRRSDYYTDFFFGGYAKGTLDGIPDFRKVTLVNRTKWYFNDKYYLDFVDEIERLSKWTPSGGTDLILTNARCDGGKTKAYLDLSSAMSLDLEKAKSEELFQTVPHFFERIFHFARTVNESRLIDPVSDLSDAIGVRLAKNSLREAMIAWLPESIRKQFRSAFTAVVSDISKPADASS